MLWPLQVRDNRRRREMRSALRTRHRYRCFSLRIHPERIRLECDAVVHLRNGSYGLIEIKLGGDTLIDDGARTLSTLAQKIDTDKMKAPAFSMVLVGIGDYAYRRPDGVYVVPIGSLRN